MAQHVQVKVDTGLAIYFCDRQSPRQRGTTENANGLLGQYLPKGIESHEVFLRRRRRGCLSPQQSTHKTLAWRAPGEEVDALLHSAQQQHVATAP